MDVGYETDFAANVAYLIVPLVFLILLFPLWRTEKAYLLAQFRLADLNSNVAIKAVTVGLLVRAAWWSQLIAGVSLGFYSAPETSQIVPFSLNLQCPPALVIGLGLFVMTLVVPVVEEIVHRTYVQGVLRRRGLIISVLISAIAFAVFHRYSSMLFAFLAGCVFGVQYWIAKSLWPSVVSHATINALAQLDWRCLSVQWNPASDSLPLVLPGFIAVACLIASGIAIAILLRGMAIGAPSAPIAVT